MEHFRYLRQLKLGSHGVVSGWEVGLSHDLSSGAQLLLVLGELVSQSSGKSWSELNWESSEGVLGAVLGVELLEGLGALESGLELLSVLVVDDSQTSGDGLSDELKLVTAAMRMAVWPTSRRQISRPWVLIRAFRTDIPKLRI